MASSLFPFAGDQVMGSTYERDRREMNRVIRFSRFSRIQQFSNHQTDESYERGDHSWGSPCPELS